MTKVLKPIHCPGLVGFSSPKAEASADTPRELDFVLTNIDDSTQDNHKGCHPR